MRRLSPLSPTLFSFLCILFGGSGQANERLSTYLTTPILKEYQARKPSPATHADLVWLESNKLPSHITVPYDETGVSKIIDGVLAAFAQEDLRTSVSFGYAPSTNINKATTKHVAETLFGPAKISSDKAKSGAGFSYALNLSSSPTRYPNIDLYYGGTAFDDPSLSFSTATLSITHPASQETSFGISLGRAWSGGSSFSDNASLSLTSTRQVSRQANLNFKTVIKNLEYAQGISSQTASFSGSFTQIIGRNTSLESVVKLSRTFSDFSPSNLLSREVSLRTIYELEHWQVAGTMGYSFSKYDRAQALFPKARSDKSLLISLSLMPRGLDVFGLQPIVKLSWLSRKSNIAHYGIDSLDAYIGFQALHRR